MLEFFGKHSVGILFLGATFALSISLLSIYVGSVDFLTYWNLFMSGFLFAQSLYTKMSKPMFEILDELEKRK